MRGRTPAPDGEGRKDGMGYTESLLATNEKIVYRTKQHWMAPIFGTVAGSLVLIGGVALFVFHLTMGTEDLAGTLRTLAFWGSLILLLVGLAMVGYSYIQWWVEDYAVTNQKVVKVGRTPQQEDERRGPREDQRRRHGAGSARPDARLRDAEGGDRLGQHGPRSTRPCASPPSSGG